jgi:hypothetical protein
VENKENLIRNNHLGREARENRILTSKNKGLWEEESH